VFRTQFGMIHSNLRIGADVGGTNTLQGNLNLSCPGVKLHGSGFIVTPEEAANLGLGRIPGLERHIRGYLNGRDVTQSPRGVMVIDLFGLDAPEVRERFPEVYQWVAERVKTEREGKVGGTKDSADYAKHWWLFKKTRSSFRPALQSVSRYISTTETAKHRFFVFLNHHVLPDNMLISIAADDAAILGILSSHIHVAWALASGGTLEDRPRYNKTRCFETFPFPAAHADQLRKVAALAGQLDAHRKRQQELHPDLTMTGMYNVLEKRRSGEELTAKEKQIHEKGLVSVLKQIHDELNAAVFDAYGWPHDSTDEQILERLVALNHERAEEEKRGLIRCLRPEFQNPSGGKPSVQPELELAGDSEHEDETEEPTAKQRPKRSQPKQRPKPPQKPTGQRNSPNKSPQFASHFRTTKARQHLKPSPNASNQSKPTRWKNYSTPSS